MRVENLLTIFGLLVVVSGYGAVIAALVGFDFIGDQRNLYLLGGVGSVLWGTLMLGVAKAVNQQADVLHQMDDVRRTVRNQTKIVNELGGGKAKSAPRANQPQQQARAKQPPRPEATPGTSAGA